MQEEVRNVLVHLTPIQRKALIELVERAEITGRDAPLVTGILRALASASATHTDIVPPSALRFSPDDEETA